MEEGVASAEGGGGGGGGGGEAVPKGIRGCVPEKVGDCGAGDCVAAAVGDGGGLLAVGVGGLATGINGCTPEKGSALRVDCEWLEGGGRGAALGGGGFLCIAALFRLSTLLMKT